MKWMGGFDEQMSENSQLANWNIPGPSAQKWYKRSAMDVCVFILWRKHPESSETERGVETVKVYGSIQRGLTAIAYPSPLLRPRLPGWDISYGRINWHGWILGSVCSVFEISDIQFQSTYDWLPLLRVRWFWTLPLCGFDLVKFYSLPDIHILDVLGVQCNLPGPFTHASSAEF